MSFLQITGKPVINSPIGWTAVNPPPIHDATKPCTNFWSFISCHPVVDVLYITLPLTPTFWPTAWLGGHNPFARSLGKYFLPDSAKHTQLGGTDWLWIPGAEPDRLVWGKNTKQNKTKKMIKEVVKAGWLFS